MYIPELETPALSCRGRAGVGAALLLQDNRTEQRGSQNSEGGRPPHPKPLRKSPQTRPSAQETARGKQRRRANNGRPIHLGGKSRPRKLVTKEDPRWTRRAAITASWTSEAAKRSERDPVSGKASCAEYGVWEPRRNLFGAPGTILCSPGNTPVDRGSRGTTRWRPPRSTGGERRHTAAPLHRGRPERDHRANTKEKTGPLRRRQAIPSRCPSPRSIMNVDCEGQQQSASKLSRVWGSNYESHYDKSGATGHKGKTDVCPKWCPILAYDLPREVCKSL